MPVIIETERANVRPVIDAAETDNQWLREVCVPHLRKCLEVGSLWVCEDNSGPIGHYYYSPTTEPGVIALDSIQIVPPRQRRGYCTMLLNHFLQKCHEEGVVRKVVIAIERNHFAVKLYEVFGFSIIGGNERKHLMEKIL